MWDGSFNRPTLSIIGHRTLNTSRQAFEFAIVSNPILGQQYTGPIRFRADKDVYEHVKHVYGTRSRARRYETIDIAVDSGTVSEAALRDMFPQFSK